jgi:hypothetical protein
LRWSDSKARWRKEREKFCKCSSLSFSTPFFVFSEEKEFIAQILRLQPELASLRIKDRRGGRQAQTKSQKFLKRVFIF